MSFKEQPRLIALKINNSVNRYRAKALKIRTLARRKMSKTMAEFAKYRGVEVNNLGFHLKVLLLGPCPYPLPMPLTMPMPMLN